MKNFICGYVCDLGFNLYWLRCASVPGVCLQEAVSLASQSLQRVRLCGRIKHRSIVKLPLFLTHDVAFYLLGILRWYGRQNTSSPCHRMTRQLRQTRPVFVNRRSAENCNLSGKLLLTKIFYFLKLLRNDDCKDGKNNE